LVSVLDLDSIALRSRTPRRTPAAGRPILGHTSATLMCFSLHDVNAGEPAVWANQTTKPIRGWPW
jgi:hypothetical protein